MPLIQLIAGGQQHDAIVGLQSDLAYSAAVIVASYAHPFKGISHHSAVPRGCEHHTSAIAC